MLSLKPPFLQVDDLMIFPDDKDERTFYYLSQRPSITRNSDGKPSISAYAILPEASGSGGNSISEAGLSLDVNLSVTQEELDLAAKAITQQFGKSPNILSPAPLIDGKAKFVMAQAGQEVDSSKWFVTSDVRPSLSGTNNVSLVARATGEDAKLLTALVNSGSTPAGIFYELSIIGTTPVYHAHMEANMSVIYHHFDSHIRLNAFFTTTDITSVLDELVEDRAIVMEVEELDPAIKADAMKSLFDELSRKVIDTLFEPASLLSIKESTSEKIRNGITSVISSFFPGAYFSRRTLDETQLKTIRLDLSQKNTKTFVVYPQARLNMMLEDANVDLQSIISWIDLDTMPYFQQDVKIDLPTDTFVDSNINSVSVNYRVLNAETGEEIKSDYSNFSAKSNNWVSKISFNRCRDIKYRYEYKLTINLDSGSIMIPGKIETGWICQEDPEIHINPEDYLEKHELDLFIEDTAVFSCVEKIKAEVAAIEKNRGETVFSNTIFFSKDNMENRHFVLVTNKDLVIDYSLELTYYQSDANALKVSQDNVFGNYFIPNPLSNSWSVDLFCIADWEKINRVYLDTRIFDVGREVPLEKQFKFNTDKEEDTLNVHCNPKTPKRVFDYRVRVLFRDGSSVLAGWYSSKGASLQIDADFLKNESIVHFNIVSCPNFDLKDIQKATLEITYKTQEGEDITDLVNLAGHDESFIRSIINKDPNSDGYSYRITALSTYGEIFRSPWTCTDEENVIVEFPHNLW